LQSAIALEKSGLCKSSDRKGAESPGDLNELVIMQIMTGLLREGITIDLANLANLGNSTRES
jgi:hypothetical protein